jgi:hypothetical protein
VRTKPGQLEHQFDLTPERAGHDGQLETLEGCVLDEIGRAGNQPHGSADRALVLGVFPDDCLL